MTSSTRMPSAPSLRVIIARRLDAHFFALGGEDLAHRVLRRQFAPRAGHHRRHQFLINGLRHVRLHASQLAGVKPVAHGHREADIQPLARLHAQPVLLRAGLFAVGSAVPR